ncbi:(+)-neomenthol dehydrogenase-like isoform X1 [Trifolium pratense]|uniref:(+)-neomenthol dehydrogenase-like isoform X1 n=1 Tax=Trifolium pratense TaxID=57577 RepID=UPI001E698067|nr:(+)-neomenthol dehydrogenase-like isoform X1 [Trifolium pratense]
MGKATKRYAVVTGSNKGIGFEIVRQLASAEINVVLTARDEKRGLQALETLKSFGLSDFVVFHQLDIADASSIASLANFVKSEFGKLDILVTNAGIIGTIIHDKELFNLAIMNRGALSEDNRRKAVTQTYELAEECLQTNYYGAKITTESFLPLLKLSDSPRIVNVSSTLGQLESIPNGWPKSFFNDVDNLTEEKVDKVLKKFLKDFKEGSLDQENGWPKTFSAYIISKAAMNAYTRILAKNFPTLCINSVCPGYVVTDITANTGLLTVEEGASSVVRLALLRNSSPSGLFFYRSGVSSF